MAQNRQITGNMQGLQYQLHDGVYDHYNTLSILKCWNQNEVEHLSFSLHLPLFEWKNRIVSYCCKSIGFYLNLLLFLGDGVENERNYPAVEAHELERPIIAPGNNDYQLILAGFKAHIPEQVKNGMYLSLFIQILWWKIVKELIFLYSS